MLVLLLMLYQYTPNTPYPIAAHVFVLTPSQNLLLLFLRLLCLRVCVSVCFSFLTYFLFGEMPLFWFPLKHLFSCVHCVCACACAGVTFHQNNYNHQQFTQPQKLPSNHETNYSNAAVADDDDDDNDDDKNNDADGIRLMVSKMATITNPSPYRNYMDARLFCRLDLVFIVYITRPLTYTLYLSTICVCVCDSMSFWYLLIVSIHLLPLTFSFDMHLAFDVLCCCCG